MENKRFITKKEWKQLYKDYYNSLDGWGIIGKNIVMKMNKEDESITTGKRNLVITLSPYNETDVKVMRSLVANGKDIIMQLKDKNKDLIMYIVNSMLKEFDVYERESFFSKIGLDVIYCKTNNDADPNYEINTTIASFMTKGRMRIDYVMSYREIILRGYEDQIPEIVYENRPIEGFINYYMNNI